MNLNPGHLPTYKDLVPVLRTQTTPAHKASLELSDEQKLVMAELTTFNLRARYPDYKNRFQKKADRQYTETHLNKIREMRKWLQEKIKG